MEKDLRYAQSLGLRIAPNQRPATVQLLVPKSRARPGARGASDGSRPSLRIIKSRRGIFKQQRSAMSSQLHHSKATPRARTPSPPLIEQDSTMPTDVLESPCAAKQKRKLALGKSAETPIVIDSDEDVPASVEYHARSQKRRCHFGGIKTKAIQEHFGHVASQDLSTLQPAIVLRSSSAVGASRVQRATQKEAVTPPSNSKSAAIDLTPLDPLTPGNWDSDKMFTPRKTNVKTPTKSSRAKTSAPETPKRFRLPEPPPTAPLRPSARSLASSATMSGRSSPPPPSTLTPTGSRHCVSSSLITPPNSQRSLKNVPASPPCKTNSQPSSNKDNDKSWKAELTQLLREKHKLLEQDKAIKLKRDALAARIRGSGESADEVASALMSLMFA